MGKFDLTDDKIQQIADKFIVDKDVVKEIVSVYKDIDSILKQQYLAHIIRAAEEFVRQQIGNPTFIIKCVQRKPEASLEGFGSAQYIELKNRFLIYYHPSQSEKVLRVIIAHELGHLILRVKAKKTGIKNTEPLSTIFGLITILEKNRFYEEETSRFQYETWENMLADFSLLHNQWKGKVNIS